jgi:hypothetical protein
MMANFFCRPLYIIGLHYFNICNSKQNLIFEWTLVQWPAKKVSHHLNVSVIKALITHLDFDVTEK